MSRPSRTAPEQCAQCGEEIPPHARACPGCGADERTGWREPSIYDGLDLPDETSATPPRGKSRALRGSAWVVMIALVVILALSAFGLL